MNLTSLQSNTLLDKERIFGMWGKTAQTGFFLQPTAAAPIIINTVSSAPWCRVAGVVTLLYSAKLLEAFDKVFMFLTVNAGVRLVVSS